MHNFVTLHRLTLNLFIMKRIKINGKAQSKFSLCFIMGYWRNLPWTVMCDAFTYEYIANRFEEFAFERGIKFNY